MMKCVGNDELYIKLSVLEMGMDHSNTIEKFYPLDQTQMSEEIAKLFFEFLNHMEKLTDVIKSMAEKMQEMDKRIEALEKKRNEDDDKFTKVR